jgi:ligand-binding SRPBCC domain-containing protein
MLQRFVTAHWIPFTVDIVFAFFANPRNLPPLMPTTMRTRIESLELVPPCPSPMNAGSQWSTVEQSAGVGSQVDLSFRPMAYVPMRVHWVARITEFVWYSHFSDVQVRGPFEFFHHRHGICPDIQQGRVGTLLTDEIEFSLPLGTVGHLWDKAVHRHLKKTFGLRQERLPRLLGAAVRHTS